MKRRASISSSLLLMVLAVSVLHGQAFMDKGSHPRLIGLGHAVTALEGEASSLFYNPAVLTSINGAQAFAGFTELYPMVEDDDLNVLNAGAAYSLGELGVVAVGISQFSPNFWTERTMVLSYGTSFFTDGLSLGVSAKLLSWSADAPSGEYAVPEPALSYTGFTLDLGVYYKVTDILEQNDLQLGAAVTDLTQPSVASNGSSDASLPLSITAGAALRSRKHDYTIFAALRQRDGDLKVMAGYEITAMKTQTLGMESEFLVRFGGGRVTAADSQGEYNGGFGVRVEDLRIDYAYTYQAFIRHVGGISSVAISYAF
ncbi:MAG: hypothetical protein HUU02_10980 [Bacteroidetes bacterium]|nr:hypothetical protein [Bacteroidota bacterium]